MAIWFKLVSEFQTIHRRPFGLTKPEYLKPTEARPLVEGEFLELDSNYKMDRGGDDVVGTLDPTTVPVFAYFAEQGRYEVQSINKGPFLYLGDYEADTKIMDATALSVGDPVTVVDLVVGSSPIVRRGLGAMGAGTITVGYVTRLPANNNGYLRFIRALP